MIKEEWKHILRSKKLLVPMLAVLFIPILYAGMFLWAFWDPYENLSDLPVAVVNMDEGAELEGVQLDIGNELTKNLTESKEFNFQAVTKEEAEKGLANQAFYLSIEIPANFSEHATTLLDENPQKLTMLYKPNEGYNFLSGQIGETAMDRIRAQVNEEVTTTYAEQLFDSITKLGDGFTEASDGAGKLKDGADEINKGANDLKGYLEQLASSTVTLSDGTNTVVSGIQSAANGSNDLNTGLVKLESGSSQLLDGVNKTSEGATVLQSGLTQYTAGVSQLNDSYKLLGEKGKEINAALEQIKTNTATVNDSTNQLSQGSANVTAGIQALSKQLAQLSGTLPAEQAEALTGTLKQLEQGSTAVTEGLGKLATGTAQLSEGTAKAHGGAVQISGGYAQALQGVEKLNESSSPLVKGAGDLAAGTGTLAEKMTEFNAGVASAADGSTKLVSGLNELAAGSGQLQEGTTSLAEKSGELATGSSKLADGTTELLEGTGTLQSKLHDASEEVGDVKATDDTYSMMASPVDVDVEAVNPVPNYGTGFAPYFMSLGLFVGALLISIVFPLVQPAIKPTSGAAWYTSKVTVLVVVGVLQSLIAVAVMLFALKIETQSVGLFILSTLFTSFAYLALVQMLVTILADVGRFVAILVLIMQLTTSAGTFPLELIPAPLQVFNKLLPMTYSVQSFKASISTGNMSQFWSMNGVLIGFTAAFLAITFGYFMLVFSKRYSKQTTEA